jgi:hypothetical protein
VSRVESIENVVKFIKYSFFPVREFNSIKEAEDSLFKWLKRKANGKISQATMKIPLIEIETERLSLRPLRNSIFRKDRIGAREERSVSEKCRIAVDTSQYDVPEIYRNGSVDIYKTGDKLFIFDRHNGLEIAKYALSAIPGQIVSNRAMIREMGTTVQELKDEVSEYFEIPDWKVFLEINFRRFPRYVRDQCLAGRKYFKGQEIDQEKLARALKTCLEIGSFTMNDLWDNYRNQLNIDRDEIPVKLVRIINPLHVLEVEKPDMGMYRDLFKSTGGPQ